MQIRTIGGPCQIRYFACAGLLSIDNFCEQDVTVSRSMVHVDTASQESSMHDIYHAFSFFSIELADELVSVKKSQTSRSILIASLNSSLITLLNNCRNQSAMHRGGSHVGKGF